jgi:hypothetical protein
MWQRRMAAFFCGKGQILWDVMVNTVYVHPMNFLAVESRDMFDANNKAVDYLYRSLCGPELEWVRTENAHAGNAQVHARLGSGATSVAKNPMLLNGCYRWFWSLQRYREVIYCHICGWLL